MKHDIDEACGGCMVPHYEYATEFDRAPTCRECRRCGKAVHPRDRGEECEMQDAEWVPMTQDRMIALVQQLAGPGIPIIHLPTKIIEDNRLPDGPKRIQPFKKIPRRRR